MHKISLNHSKSNGEAESINSKFTDEIFVLRIKQLSYLDLTPKQLIVKFTY